MAKERAIKKRIKSIKNTKKITKTMGMVATAKSKKVLNQIDKTADYRDALKNILNSILKTDIVPANNPLFKQEKEDKVDLLVITANRGLCGGYNTNVLKMATHYLEDNKDKEIRLFVAGKKGISFFNFRDIKMEAEYRHIEDIPSYKDVEEIANVFMDRILAGITNKVDVIYTHYHSHGVQRPEISKLLPFDMEMKNDDSKFTPDYIFDPDKNEIVGNLIPRLVINDLYEVFLYAAASEHVARRIAMKTATDAADDMIRMLTRFYNRARQANITQELSEIVGAAEAIT